MDKTPNWKDLKLVNQCGVCVNYIQTIKYSKREPYGKRTAHGKCSLSGIYKMRTETCKKYSEGLK